MPKLVNPPTSQQVTLMIARTKRGEPMWQTNKKGRPFFLEKDGVTKRRAGSLWWWRWWPSKTRFLPAPHLTYSQVSVAARKSKDILGALRQGPIYLDNGFLKSRNNRIITTRAVSFIVLYWMEACGIVLIKKPLKNGRVEIDMDVDATSKNNVR